jgi:hypothetical protein
MKVEAIEIYNDPIGAEHVESALQKWLTNNPNVTIEHVVQTPLVHGGAAYVRVTKVIVTIFYRD